MANLSNFLSLDKEDLSILEILENLSCEGNIESMSYKYAGGTISIFTGISSILVCGASVETGSVIMVDGSNVADGFNEGSGSSTLII